MWRNRVDYLGIAPISSLLKPPEDFSRASIAVGDNIPTRLSFRPILPHAIDSRSTPLREFKTTPCHRSKSSAISSRL